MIAFQNFYRGKRVLVTGHTGFKGAWLKAWLEQLGATVTGYSLPDDVRDANGLAVALDPDEMPDVVFHLAAQALVSVSYKEPWYTLHTNVLGTTNVLDLLRSLDFKGRICCVTSDKVYDVRSSGCYSETDPLARSGDPYSLSKAAAELVCAAYRNYGLDIVSLRAGNVIGGGDWAANRIVPDCIRSLQRGEPIAVRNPHSTRPFQYVLDCLSGYLLAGCVVKCPTVLNFGPEESHTVEDVVTRVISHWGSGSWKAGEQTFAETRTLEVDSGKARRELGWKPVLTFDEAVEHTVKGYKGWPDAISAYCELAEQREAVWTRAWLEDLTP